MVITCSHYSDCGHSGKNRNWHGLHSFRDENMLSSMQRPLQWRTP